MTIKRKTITLLAAVLLVACSTALAAKPPTPAGENEPDLCDLDGGIYCTPCGGPGLRPCEPMESSGWLCCTNGGACVAIATPDECQTGVYGWCNNYIEKTHPSGVEVAICQDDLG